MPSLRTYRKKIKTIKSTQQITKAMKMVATAELRRAQNRILSARPFAFKMRDLLGDLAGRVSLNMEDILPPHPLLDIRRTNRVALFLVTADKGLCGSFNTNLIRKAGEYLKENEGKEITFFIAGRKGRDFFKRLGCPLKNEYVNVFKKLSYAVAEVIGKELIDVYLKENLSEVVIIYNEFKSVIQQKLTVEKLLPVGRPAAYSTPEAGELRKGDRAKISQEQRIDYIYEPEKRELLNALLPRYIKSQIFRVLLESSSAELGARMAAMDSATKNAGELMDSLTLKMNRMRQAGITREIAELVGGTEALN